MCGAISSHPNTPSCYGAQLKHRDNFTSTLPLKKGHKEVGEEKGDEINMDFMRLDCEDRKWMELLQDRVQNVASVLAM
jgi:hypothetical protein